MARGAWDRTAALAVCIAEPHRDQENHPSPYSANEFHPMREAEPGEATNTAIPYDPKVLEQIHAGRQTR